MALISQSFTSLIMSMRNYNQPITINIGHLAVCTNSKMSTFYKTYSGLKRWSFEMPNAQYSQRYRQFKSDTANNKTMRYLILIITTFLLTACSDKNSESAQNLIGNSDYCLIYKFDSLSNDFLLFNIPSTDTIDYFKKILTFNGKFKEVKQISPNYRFDLITNDSISGVVLIEQSAAPFLIIKSSGFVASRQLDYGLGMYLGEIEQNVYSKKDSISISYRLKNDLSNIQCGFYKNSDSISYSGLSIRNYYQSKNLDKHDLATIMEYMDIYWMVVNRDSEINLQSVHIGYPLEYTDILMRHIDGFKNSTKWNEYVSQNGKKPNYKLTAEIMLELDVYKPLNDFLKTKGLEIVDMSLEKIGLVLPEILDKYGLDNKTIIPMPHMVWIEIGKTGGNNV